MTLRTLATLAVPVGAAGMAVAYGSAFSRTLPAWAPWLYVASMALLLTAVMALGALRERRPRGERAVLAALGGMLLLLLAAFGAALALPPEAPGDPLWLGLPRRAAIVLYGVGVLPLLALPLVYAFTFERMTLSDEDLERVRRARRAPSESDAA